MEPAPNIFENEAASWPKLPVSVICGNMFAVATPTCAVAWCSSAEYSRTSGRCSTNLDGRLTGRSFGMVKESRLNWPPA